MTNPQTITVDDVQYVRSDSIEKYPPHDAEVRIVVLQRGWIVVGYYAEDGDRVLVSNAAVVRKWGTSKGLGELRSGPLADTVLDPAGSVEAHRLGVVFTIACDADKWRGSL